MYIFRINFAKNMINFWHNFVKYLTTNFTVYCLNFLKYIWQKFDQLSTQFCQKLIIFSAKSIKNIYAFSTINILKSWLYFDKPISNWSVSDKILSTVISNGRSLVDRAWWTIVSFFLHIFSSCFFFFFVNVFSLLFLFVFSRLKAAYLE